MRLILTWLISALALLLVSWFMPGFHVDGVRGALIAALVIGLINATLGLFLKIVTFPLTLVTLGLFWLVINAVMLLVADALLDSFDVSGFFAAFFGAIVLALVNIVLRKLLLPDKERD